MKTTKKSLENEKLLSVLKDAKGYNEIRKENLENPLYYTKCKIESEEGRKPIRMFFVDRGLVVLERGNNKPTIGFIKYKDIAENKIYDKKKEVYLKISIENGCKSFVFVLKDKNDAQKIIMMIRIGREKMQKSHEEVVMSDEEDKIISIVRFGKLRLLLTCSVSSDFASFKKKAIHRLGKHFYPNKEISENNIDISEYTEVLLFANYEGAHILLENNSDFRAAVAFFNKKLDVLITMKRTKRTLDTDTIDITSGRL